MNDTISLWPSAFLKKNNCFAGSAGEDHVCQWTIGECVWNRFEKLSFLKVLMAGMKNYLSFKQFWCVFGENNCFHDPNILYKLAATCSSYTQHVSTRCGFFHLISLSIFHGCRITLCNKTKQVSFDKKKDSLDNPKWFDGL